MKPSPLLLSDDAQEHISQLVRERIPWLLLGLAGAACASLLVAHFEEALQANIALAFFIPAIVYLADAVGTQTETLYVRALSQGRTHFITYLKKELFVGILLGASFGTLASLLSYLWLGSLETAQTVGLALGITMALAPLVALVVPQILFKEHTDPALGAGPLTTVIQDVLSLCIYFIVATFILL